MLVRFGRLAVYPPRLDRPRPQTLAHCTPGDVPRRMHTGSTAVVRVRVVCHSSGEGYWRPMFLL